jgi:hypothetical protein
MATAVDEQALVERLQQADDAGDFAAVAAIMRAHVARADVQRACIVALTGIAQALLTSGVVSACAGAMEAVVAAMSDHKDHRTLQLAGCRALFYLAQAANFQPAPAWAYAIRVVVAALRAHLGDNDMHTQGCSALICLCKSDASSLFRVRAGRLGIVEHLLTSMRLQPASADVQAWAVQALSYVLTEQEPATIAAHAGALEVVIAAMRTHADNERVQHAGCSSLSCLLEHVPALRISAGRAGAIEMIKTVLQTYAHVDSSVYAPEVAFQALTYLLHTAETRAEARAAGLMEIAVEALQPSSGSSSFTMMHVCTALGLTAKYDADFATCAGDIGAVEAVVRMLKARVNDEGCQITGLIALAQLVERCPPNAAKALRAGALDAVFAGMRAHPAHVGMQTYGAMALAPLQRCAAEAAAKAAAAAANAAAASLLAEEEAERAARLTSPPHKSKAKNKKNKQRGGGAAAAGGDEMPPAHCTAADAAHADGDAAAAAADEPAALPELQAAVPSAGEAPRSAAAERRRRRAAAKAASRREADACDASGGVAAGVGGSAADVHGADTSDAAADDNTADTASAAAPGAAALPVPPAAQPEADAPFADAPELLPPFLDLGALTLAAPDAATYEGAAPLEPRSDAASELHDAPSALPHGAPSVAAATLAATPAAAAAAPAAAVSAPALDAAADAPTGAAPATAPRIPAPRAYCPPSGGAPPASSAPSLLPPAPPAPAPPLPLPPLPLPPAASAPEAAPSHPALPPPPPEMRECVVCLDETLVRELRLLSPCGHRCVCADCAAALLARPPGARLCPLCSEAVLHAVRVWDLC